MEPKITTVAIGVILKTIETCVFTYSFSKIIKLLVTNVTNMRDSTRSTMLTSQTLQDFPGLYQIPNPEFDKTGTCRTLNISDMYEIFDKKWDLIGEKIDIQRAIDIICIPNNVNDHVLHNLQASTKDIIHIIDKINDDGENFSEWIIFRHARRRWIAYYKILPYGYDYMSNIGYLGYTATSEYKFWNTDLFDSLLVEKLRKHNAAKKIQRALIPWLDKPITNDNKKGIRAILSWRKVCSS